jgi:hypothetical protein
MAPIPTDPALDMNKSDGTNPTLDDPFLSDQLNNGSGMAYMLEHIRRNAEKVTVEKNPRQELVDYLKQPLRDQDTDAIKWWSVSWSPFRSSSASLTFQ